MLSLLTSIQTLARRLIPNHCVVCQQPVDRDLACCRDCQSKLKHNANACYQCALPLAVTGQYCGQCQQQPPAYDRTLAPFLYQDLIRDLIIGLKFNEKLLYASMMSSFFINNVHIDKMPDYLVPVPLHPNRIQERGYNQALLIARYLAKHYPLKLDFTHCRRVLDTQRQSDLDYQKRRGNVKGCFVADRVFTSRHIAIVDDVMTTGFTANELAIQLKKAGARQIDLWVIARAKRSP